MWVYLLDGSAFNLAHFWTVQKTDSGLSGRIVGKEGMVSIPMDSEDARDEVLANLTRGKGTIVA